MSAWSSFTPTAQELAYVTKLFETADPQKLGIITGDAAVPVLAGSSLPPDKLGEIWAIADHDNNGFLTKKGVAAAVRLIAWAQNGESVSETLLAKSGPLPVIKGINTPQPSRVTSPGPVAQNITGNAAGLPPLTPADRSKFLRLFATGGPVGGLLSGDKARDIFLKSRLPVEKLGQIWNLADTQNRGALDATDFAIGMHLIQNSMSNPSFQVPSALPAGFYEQVSGGATKALEAQSTGGSSNFGPLSPSRTSFAPPSSQVSAIKPQYTGDQGSGLPRLRPQTTGQGAGGSPLHPQITGGSAARYGSPSPASSGFPQSQTSSAFSNNAFASPQQPKWDVTPEEKAKADGFYDTLDPQRRGFIEGDVAVPFMLGSKLPEVLLAQIWDLADMNNDGKLTRDGFAVAMHLINGKLAGKEVPATLPPSLIPPSQRKGAPAAQPQSQIQRDLWDLEDDAPLTAPSVPTPSKAPAPAQPSAFSSAPLSPAYTGASNATATAQLPFNAASRALSPTNTGSPAPTSNEAIRRPVTRDLFDDDDDAQAQAEAAAASTSLAIANTKNQLASSQRALTSTQTTRASLEAAAAEAAGQLAALESQLASAKTQHANETKLVADLQARAGTQSAEITRVRGELVTAESDLSALRAEKAEIEGGVLRDKEEVRELNRKLKEVGEQTALVKAELEKLKKDARQQKGMLAIAKKQLATAEENAEKARKEAALEQEELARAKEELDRTNAEHEALEAAAKAASEPAVAAAIAEVPSPDAITLPASIPLPATPDVQSPSSVATKSNNPFGRLTRQNSTASSTSHSAFATSSSPSAFSPSVAPVNALAGFDEAFNISEEPAEPSAEAVHAPLPESVPTNTETGDADPFDTAFGVEEQPAAPLTVETPKAAHVEPFLAAPVTSESSHDHATSPTTDNEEFTTPPNTATLFPPPGLGEGFAASAFNPESHSAEPTRTESPETLHGDAPASNKSPEPAVIHHEEEEESSDDEADGPEDALGAGRPPAGAPPTNGNGLFDDSPFTPATATPFTTGHVTETGASAYPPSATFDDAFGLDSAAVPSIPTVVETPAPAPAATSSPFSALPPPPSARNGRTSPAKTSSGFGDSPFSTARFPPLDQAVRPASHAELDAAFGGTPTATASPAGAAALQNGNGGFSSGFETSFDDAFDFGSSTAPVAPGPAIADSNTSTPMAAPTTNGFSPTPSGFSTSSGPPPSVASAWPSVPAPANAIAAVAPAPVRAAYAPPPGPPPPATSPTVNFDDAFGLSQPTQAPVAAPAIPRPTRSSTEDDEDNRPLSQYHDRRRSISPPTLRSRMSVSPPPGGSKGKGAAANANDESAGSRSKLSLHFFGRNKKNKEKNGDSSSKSGKKGIALPESPTADEHGSYRPPRGAPPRSSTGASSGFAAAPSAQDVIGSVGPDDDIAAVKTLVGMGFTRQQAVDALEQNSYDVPAALNKLLGTA